MPTKGRALSATADSRDPFLIVCLRCEREVLTRRGWVGRDVRCPFCASVLRVPVPLPGRRAMSAEAPALTPARFFNFPCPRCDVLLEAHTGMSGRDGHCPTCGTTVEVPHIDRESGLPAPAAELDAGPVEGPTPLHAYAASGALAPEIVRQPDGTMVIRCPGCRDDNPLDANRCATCGLPFTLDAAPTGSADRQRAAGIGAMTLGVFGLPSVYLPFLLLPATLALVLGLRACAGARRGPSWMGMLGAAIGFAGLSGGVIGLALL
jgi:hypothetical protein